MNTNQQRTRLECASYPQFPFRIIGNGKICSPAAGFPSWRDGHEVNVLHVSFVLACEGCKLNIDICIEIKIAAQVPIDVQDHSCRVEDAEFSLQVIHAGKSSEAVVHCTYGFYSFQFPAHNII